MKAVYAGIALALSFASPLSAQSLPRIDMPPHAQSGAVLPPHEVLASVRSMGLEALTRPALRGRVYVLRARDAGQREKRVVVDARTGEVVRVRDVADVAPAYSPYDRRFGGYVPPRPPAAIARASEPSEFEPVLDEPLFPRQGRGMPSAPNAAQRSAVATPRAPTPKARPTSPAEPSKDVQQATPAQSANAPAAPLPSDAALAGASAIPGKSIPAPVGSRVSTPARADTEPTGDKTAIQMVPVAPLE